MSNEDIMILAWVFCVFTFCGSLICYLTARKLNKKIKNIGLISQQLMKNDFFQIDFRAGIRHEVQFGTQYVV